MGVPKTSSTAEPVVDPFDVLVAALDAAPIDNAAFTPEEIAESSARMAEAKRGDVTPIDSADISAEIARQLDLER